MSAVLNSMKCNEPPLWSWKVKEAPSPHPAQQTSSFTPPKELQPMHKNENDHDNPQETQTECMDIDMDAMQTLDFAIYKLSISDFEALIFQLIASYPLLACCALALYSGIQIVFAYFGWNHRTSALTADDVRIFERYKNFLIIGSQSCGKSRLAEQLRSAFPQLTLVSIDDLYWEPNWHRAGYKFYKLVRKQLFDKVDAPETTKGYDYTAKYANGVLMDGNYHLIKDMTWNLADCVVWLDYGFAVVMFRAVKRTLWRLITQQQVCNGNILTLHRLYHHWSVCVVSKVWHMHNKINEQQIPDLYIKQFPHKKIIRLTSPYQCEQWLKTVLASSARPVSCSD